MENTPYTPPSAEIPAALDKKDKESKRKKAKVENLGSLAFQPERPKDTKPEEGKKTERDREVPLEKLAAVEKIEVIKSLAEERAKELNPRSSGEAVDEETAAELAAATYIAHAEVGGDADIALEQAATELGLDIDASEEIEDLPEADEMFIDPHQPGEGELNVHNFEDPAQAPPASSAASGSSGSGRGTPPRPPMFGAGGGAVPPPGNPGGGSPNIGNPANPNSISGPPTITIAESLVYERRAAGRGLLVGGIVGYLLGRRRGRIKTEKRLLPTQKKLEKEVSGLQERLAANEAIIRSAAAAKKRAGGTVRTERPFFTSEGGRFSTIEMPAPLNMVPPERIGKVLMAAEAAPLAKSKQPERADASKQAETMSRADLLSLSERIVINGANLRQVFETHLVSEKGLRRIVAEHLRGGDVQRSLRRELIEREIDFERDPLLRDRARQSMSDHGGKAALNELLLQAGALAIGDEQQTVLEAREAHHKAEAAKQQRQHVVADVSLISVIVILAFLILVVVLRGH